MYFFCSYHFSAPLLLDSGGSYFSMSGWTALGAGNEMPLGSPCSGATWSRPPSFHSPARSTKTAQIPKLLWRRWQSLTRKLSAFCWRRPLEETVGTRGNQGLKRTCFLKYWMKTLITTIWCNPHENSRSPAPPFSDWAFRWTASGVTCSVTRYRLFSVWKWNQKLNSIQN